MSTMNNDKQEIFSIDHLHAHKDYASLLAYWSYLEWYSERTIPYSILKKEYERRAVVNSLPKTFIAFYNSLPVGMVSIKQTELWVYPELSPWLSALYVIPKCRKNGVGGQLVRRVMEEVSSISNKLYLFIADSSEYLESFYTSLGWQFYTKAQDNDKRESKIFIYKF